VNMVQYQCECECTMYILYNIRSEWDGMEWNWIRREMNQNDADSVKPKPHRPPSRPTLLHQNWQYRKHIVNDRGSYLNRIFHHQSRQAKIRTRCGTETAVFWFSSYLAAISHADVVPAAGTCSLVKSPGR
jgi:hypothetical protein